MRWVRRRKRFGAWLALAALALQLALSFGHVHLDAFRHGGSALALAATGGQGSQQGSQPAPAKHHDADDYCAICAVIHLAASTFVPQAPHLPLPVREARIDHRFIVVFAAPASPRVAFRSRAPPLS